MIFASARFAAGVPARPHVDARSLGVDTPHMPKSHISAPAAKAPTAIGGGATIIDLRFQGRASIIGVCVLELKDGIALVDPGPEAKLGELTEGLARIGRSLEDVRAVLLTHIHLDHATAAGAIAARSPGARVYVHGVGAPHMADPTRLLASAERIYGDRMATLWGRFVPVLAEQLRVVDDDDVVELGGRSFEVAYLPGHASHHVAYHEAATGTAWVGDVGGIRIGGGPPLPVTPPPDIDVELWRDSIARVMAWSPDRIVPTHFGVYTDPASHLGELEEALLDWKEWVRGSLTRADGRSDRELRGDFARWVEDGLSERLSSELTERYATASGFPDSWSGLARYWRKRGIG